MSRIENLINLLIINPLERFGDFIGDRLVFLLYSDLKQMMVSKDFDLNDCESFLSEIANIDPSAKILDGGITFKCQPFGKMTLYINRYDGYVANAPLTDLNYNDSFFVVSCWLNFEFPSMQFRSNDIAHLLELYQEHYSYETVLRKVVDFKLRDKANKIKLDPFSYVSANCDNSTYSEREYAAIIREYARSLI